MPASVSARRRRTASILLWSAQVILAVLFLFAGVVKLKMSGAVLEQFTGVPGAFMKFVAVSEICGALGLVLPGLFRVWRFLTPAAAVGLVAIMTGAVTLTVAHGPAGQAVMPFITGLIAASVAHGRRGWIAYPSDLPGAAWVAAPVAGD